MPITFSSSHSHFSSEHLPPWLRFKPFSPSTNFLIADSVRDPLYRKAVSLGIPVLQSTFIETSKRFNSELSAREETKYHILPRFAGVSVYFVGQCDSRLAITVGEYGGSVVHSASSATHIVVSPGEEAPHVARGQFLVTTSWIRESLDLGWMANEANFEVRPQVSRLRRRSAKIARKLSKSQNKTQQDPSSLKYKRFQLCRELYLSEINCLKAIDFLIRINEEYNFLTEAQNEVIFGCFLEQKKLHSELVANLGKVLEGWNDHSQIGSIFVQLASQMEEAYIPYFQGLSAALEMFKECKTKNAKFRNYIKEKEKDRSIDKQKVEYLLNNPMQQLTSRVGVTLKEILAKTEASSADSVCVRAAIDVVDDILRKCNNFKKESSESEVIYRQVKNIPARILCSSRRFLSRCAFMCISSPVITLPCLVELLLFEDVLMITRRQPHNNVSCISFTSTGRRAKFVDVYPMAGVREIQLRSREGPSLAEFTLRRPEGDCEWILEIINEMDVVMKFLQLLIQQVEKVCGRSILIRTITSAHCPKTPEASKLTPSSFVRSLSSSSAVKSLRSYSQRLRLRRNVSADVPSFYQRSPPERNALPAGEWTPKRPPIHEAVDEEEHVNPYENVKFFSPLKNIDGFRHRSIMDECC